MTVVLPAFPKRLMPLICPPNPTLSPRPTTLPRRLVPYRRSTFAHSHTDTCLRLARMVALDASPAAQSLKRDPPITPALRRRHGRVRLVMAIGHGGLNVDRCRASTIISATGLAGSCCETPLARVSLRECDRFLTRHGGCGPNRQERAAGLMSSTSLHLARTCFHFATLLSSKTPGRILETISCRAPDLHSLSNGVEWTAVCNPTG